MSASLPPGAIAQAQTTLGRLRANLRLALRGKDDVIDQLLVCVAAGGHVLLEDLPGVGKTTLAYALARSTDCGFSRIQFTSDLLPGDVTGVAIYDETTREFVFKPGPVFANIVLADEINRAPPKTQSALLEVMDRARVTVDGVAHAVGTPFLVFATQNPVDYEGTFPLPESQMDRFLMRLQMGYPPPADELEILRSSRGGYDSITLAPVATRAEVQALQALVPEIFVEDSVLDYILRLVTATRAAAEFKAGISVRGSLALRAAAQARALARGRDFVLPEDVAEVVPAVLGHRLGLARSSGDALEERRAVGAVLSRLLGALPRALTMARDASARPAFWRNLVWSVVWPRPRERIAPTVSGTVLIGLCLGLGTAAYNSASNILFIALSLLLACLILSGLLAWLNLRRVTWVLALSPPLRAGRETAVGLEVHNAKGFLPTYALWFQFAARLVAHDAGRQPESTFVGRGIDVRAILAKAGEATARGNAFLVDRLDPGAAARLEWRFTPARRGRLRVELEGVGSLFPFGFLRKLRATRQRQEVSVWPAPVAYQRLAAAGARRSLGGLEGAKAGGSGDLLALRRYAAGDSHRLVHWKASARSGRLLVRQFSDESAEAYLLWVRTDEARWGAAERFELLLSFAASLAEDLFRAGSLEAVAVDGGPVAVVQRLADLEGFLDRLAAAVPTPSEPAAGSAPRATRQRLLTFHPDGAHGVAAYVNGIKTAAA